MWPSYLLVSPGNVPIAYDREHPPQTVLERELGGDGGAQGKYGDGRGTPPLPLATALTLNPYYFCPWGKKKILGKRVEEGEGLGPRKELFELAAAQFTELWRPVQPSRCEAWRFS